MSAVEELQATRLRGSSELVALLQSLQALWSRLGTSTTTSKFANISNNGMTCSHGNTNSNEIAGMSYVSGSQATSMHEGAAAAYSVKGEQRQ